MFEEKGLDCIFLETNMNMKKQYHMVYECIPLPKEVGDMAPIYFKVFIIVFTNIFIFCCIMVLKTVIFILIFFSYILINFYIIKKWCKAQKILLFKFLKK